MTGEVLCRIGQSKLLLFFVPSTERHQSVKIIFRPRIWHLFIELPLCTPYLVFVCATPQYASQLWGLVSEFCLVYPPCLLLLLALDSWWVTFSFTLDGSALIIEMQHVNSWVFHELVHFKNCSDSFRCTDVFFLHYNFCRPIYFSDCRTVWLANDNSNYWTISMLLAPVIRMTQVVVWNWLEVSINSLPASYLLVLKLIEQRWLAQTVRIITEKVTCGSISILLVLPS